MSNKTKLNVSLHTLNSDTLIPSVLPDIDSSQLFNFLRLSLELAADEVFWMKSNSEIFYVNEAACKKLGYQREELIGMKVWEWDPLFPKDVWPTFWKELKEKKQLEFETKHQSRNGAVFPVNIKGHYIQMGEEEVLFAFVTDISERVEQQNKLLQLNEKISEEVKEKIAELEQEKEIASKYAHKLEENNYRYNLLVEGTDMGLWTWDVQTSVNYWSPKFYQLLGFENNEIKASFDEWANRLHPDDKESTINALNLHIQQQKKYDTEFRLLCKNNQYKWFRVKGKAQFNLAGQPIYMVGSLEDIQRHKSLEAAYLFEQQKFKEFVNLAPVGIAINRMSDGKFEYVNKEFSRFTGYEVDELNSMDYWQLTPKKYQRQEQEQLIMMNETGRYGPYHKEYIHKQGGEYPVLLSGIKITDLHGQDCIWSVVQDISEQKKVEHELLIAKRKAEIANIAKSQFLASMSHEIRTPMNGILGTLQLIKKQNNDTQEQKLLENALTSTYSLLTIINDILDFSKIEANMLTLEEVEFSARQIVELVISSVGQSIKNKSVSLKSGFAKNFHDTWLGDPTRVKQVLTNLLSNATKFTEQGDVTIELSSVHNKHAHSLVIVVTDTGIGMNDETIKNLFSRFTQADSSTTRKYGGTGLGMAITKNLVELMNGTIHVSSELGIGSRFEVTLPLKQGQNVAATGHKKTATIPNLKTKKILIAEDNEVNQLIIESMLAKTNATVCIAENGQEAISLYKSFQPDFIFMDIQMPEMDGVEACKKIRELSCNIPIVALTANVMLEDVHTYLENGFNSHLGKPIVLEQLYQQLDKYLISYDI